MRRRLLYLLILLVTIAALLPTIVAKTPLRNTLVAGLMPGGIRVSIGAASLGWFTAPSASRIEVLDAAGGKLLDVESVRLDRTLWSLATDPRDLGQIEIVRPTLYVSVRPDGSNVEDALRPLLSRLSKNEPQPAENATPQATAVTLRLVEATVFAEDVAAGRRWRLHDVNLQFDSHGAAGALGQIALSGRLEEGQSQPAAGDLGRFAISLAPATDQGAGQQQVTLQCNGLPLSALGPWLRRGVAGAALAGTLSGQGAATWTQGATPNVALPPDLRTSGLLVIDRLDAAAPVLSGDRVRLARVELPWRINSRMNEQGPRGVVIEELQLRSDVGQLAVRGTIDLAAVQRDIEVRGAVDVARLAAMLPRAMRVREDTTITSGMVELALHEQPAAVGQLLTGSLRTVQLGATSGGRQLRWDAPVSATFAVRRTSGGLLVDSLQCTSEFLTMDASGNAEKLGASARFDLNRLASQLGQFIDLSGIELAGTGEITANLRIADSAISATGTTLVITNLRAANSEWSINEPRVEFAGDARWDGAGGAILSDDAQFVTSTVSLKVKDLRLGGPPGARQFSGAAAFRADLARLAATRAKTARTNPIDSQTYLPSGQISGNLGVSNQNGRVVAELNVTGQNFALTPLQRASDGRSVEMPTIWQEPKLSLRGLAAYDSTADRLSFDTVQIQSNTLAASVGGHIEKLSTTADTTIQGTLNYDLAQLTPLLRPYFGGGIQLSGREQARFAAAGRLRDDPRSVTATPASLTLNAQPSTLNQTHWSRRVQARLELPWSGANVYGLPVSGGRIAAALADGALRVDPLALAVSDGRLTAAPSVKFDPEPMELSLPAGPLLADVRISTEVSEAMLKYIAPVLAGATQSEGQFSMRLDGARLPLADSKKADVAGQLTVHSVRVVPGPMAREWIGLAQQIEKLMKQGNPLGPAGEPASPSSPRQVTLLSIRDQPVNFRVAGGRVHHESMEFAVDDVVLRSQGSVGLDETISLVLTVPIQDRWIEKQRVLASLKGQSLQIPITGTLTRPQMDKNALANLSGQLIQGAAGQAVGNELNRALDKLFKPK